jgi:hypothetical protein
MAKRKPVTVKQAAMLQIKLALCWSRTAAKDLNAHDGVDAIDSLRAARRHILRAERTLSRAMEAQFS